jgi:superfamily II DNA/RNA helicase
MKSVNFPELDWVLTDGQKIIIFCATIALGFRVVCYLWRFKLAEYLNFADRNKRIRMYNSLNWPSFNTETLGFLNNNPEVHIIIATDTLSVGINSPAETVVIFGLPSWPEDARQKIGRIRKPRGNARGIIYLPRGSVVAARNVVEAAQNGNTPLTQLDVQTDVNKGNNGHGKKKKTKPPMDFGVANLIVAPCKEVQFDIEFDNPVEDVPCTCLACQQNPPPPRKEKCDCSGCQPKEKPKRSRNTTKKARSSTVAVEMENRELTEERNQNSGKSKTGHSGC